MTQRPLPATPVESLTVHAVFQTNDDTDRLEQQLTAITARLYEIYEIDNLWRHVLLMYRFHAFYSLDLEWISVRVPNGEWVRWVPQPELAWEYEGKRVVVFVGEVR